MTSSWPGLGVMIHYLSGGSPESASTFYGKKISSVEMTGEEFKITFSDGEGIKILDNGQSCCESRYMTCDDNIQSLVGHTLVRIEAKDGPSIDDGNEAHETCFVEIATDTGFITLTNHNEHNGYYGGFGLSIVKF